MDLVPVVRFGILGAARIAPAAIVKPARKNPEASIVAVAARQPLRARRFAKKHGIPRIHQSYDALIADTEVDAVYIALPNNLHALWTDRALREGKHVLCEKPLAANADEARRVSRLAAEKGLVLCEAMHYRFHPVAKRMKEHVQSGRLGPLRQVEAYFCVPPLPPGNIRFKFELAGGATMDLGCYTVDAVRFLTGKKPDVLQAKAALASTQIDRWMKADLQFPDACTGHVFCSLRSLVVWRQLVVLTGDRGSLRVTNPFAPHFYNRLTLRDEHGVHHERIPGEKTYDYQLSAFTRAVRSEEPLPFEPANAVANMDVIDKIYAKAGLRRRAGELA